MDFTWFYFAKKCEFRYQILGDDKIKF